MPLNDNYKLVYDGEHRSDNHRSPGDDERKVALSPDGLCVTSLVISAGDASSARIVVYTVLMS